MLFRSLQNFIPIKELVEPEIGREMQRAVEERKETQHAAILDQPILLCEFAQRCDGQRNQQEAQRPIARGVSDDFQWIRAKIVLESAPTQARDRYQAPKKNDDFAPAYLH